jgi:8-oxo-dGTP diphosphatase
MRGRHATFHAVRTGEERRAASNADVAQCRELLVSQRTALINALRGHFAEFGIVVAQGARNARILLAILHNESDADLRADARTALLPLASALVDIDGRVLITRRPPGKPMAGLWEFPGGKLDPGETPEAAIIREMDEELGVNITDSCLAPLTFASHDYPKFHLLMVLFVCRRWTGTPVPREDQHLKWVRPNRLRDFPMPPADEPLISHLTDLL